MAEITIYKNLPKLANESLRKATTEICNSLIEQEKAGLKIAFIMACVERGKLYETDGFKNAADYGMKVFGWKKTQSYDYLKIGNKFLDENGATLLPADGEYTVSQLVPLLPLPLEDSQKLNSEREITPEMTVKQIKAVVKEYTSADGDAEDLEDETEVEESTEIPRNEEGEEVDDEKDFDSFRVWDVLNALTYLAERISTVPEKYPENALQTVEKMIEEYTAFEQACGFSK